MIRLLRAIMGLSSAFCVRWGHDIYRQAGPGRESLPWFGCADPDCFWSCDYLPSPEYRRVGDRFIWFPEHPEPDSE